MYIQVVAAVIQGSNDEILLAKRKKEAHQGGLWEFPGGKVDEGESAFVALKRELFEELNIHVEQARPLIKVHHRYPDKSVCLDVWSVTQFSGQPYGKEGQPIEWVKRNALSDRRFPEANQPILKAIYLPACYTITPDLMEGSLDAKRVSLFATELCRTLELGASLIQLRMPTLNDNDYLALYREALAVFDDFEAKLVVNRSLGFFESYPGHGLHLNSQELMQLSQRPIARHCLLGASCHSLDELIKAQAIECDYVSLSPVQPTMSHPDVPILGWEKFGELVSKVNLPVFALGGVAKDDLEVAWNNGAQGVCGISAFWKSSKRGIYC